MTNISYSTIIRSYSTQRIGSSTRVTTSSTSPMALERTEPGPCNEQERPISYTWGKSCHSWRVQEAKIPMPCELGISVSYARRNRLPQPARARRPISYTWGKSCHSWRVLGVKIPMPGKIATTAGEYWRPKYLCLASYSSASSYPKWSEVWEIPIRLHTT